MTSFLPYRAGVWLLTLVTATVTGVAQAQVNQSPESNTASAVESYQPYSAQQVQPWRESNDNVGRIGGWRTYAKEMSQPDSAASPKVEAGTPAGHHEGKQ